MKTKTIEQYNKEIKILDFQIGMETIKYDKDKPGYLKIYKDWNTQSHERILTYLQSQLSGFKEFDSTKLDIKLYDDESLKIYYGVSCLVDIQDYAKINHRFGSRHVVRIDTQHKFESNITQKDVLIFELIAKILTLYSGELFTILSEIIKSFNPIQEEYSRLNKIGWAIEHLTNKKTELENQKNFILFKENLQGKISRMHFEHTYFSIGKVYTKTVIFYKEEGGYVYYFQNDFSKEQFDKDKMQTGYLEKSPKAKFYNELFNCFKRNAETNFYLEKQKEK